MLAQGKGDPVSVRRLLCLDLIVLAAAIVALDLVSGLSGAGLLAFVSLGDLWGRLSAASLNLLQAIVQRYLFAALWDPVLVTLLLLLAWLVFGASGLLLYISGRKSIPAATQIRDNV